MERCRVGNSSIFERACGLALACLAAAGLVGCLDDPIEEGSFVCETNADCAPGFLCGEEGLCVEFVCGSPNDCGSGEGCINNECVPAECQPTIVGLQSCFFRDLDFCHPTSLQCVECLSDGDCIDDDDEGATGPPQRCDLDRGQCFVVDRTLCGNGEVDRGEDCEPDVGQTVSCSEISRDLSGSLSCDRNCRFDPSDCAINAECGNGVLEIFEECDGANLGGITCLAEGYGPGQVTCTPECYWDFSTCGEFLSKCGDGVLNPEEDCDDGNRSDTDGCDDECEIEAGWDCFPTPVGFTFCERTGGPEDCTPVSMTLAEGMLPAPIPERDAPELFDDPTIPLEGGLTLRFEPDMSFDGQLELVRLTGSYDHLYSGDVMVEIRNAEFQVRRALWEIDENDSGTFDKKLFPPQLPAYPGAPVDIVFLDVFPEFTGELLDLELELCVIPGGPTP